MSNGIAPLASLSAAEPVTPAGGRGGTPSNPQPAPAEASAAAAALHPNPAFRIDAALGIVVMELNNDSGQIASTIPTAQQLAAYRRAAGASHAATAPPGGTAAGTPGTGWTTTPTDGAAGSEVPVLASPQAGPAGLNPAEATTG
jgi:hypothetical protein